MSSGVSGKSLTVTMVGVVLAWSALRGKKISTTIRDLIYGKNPADDPTIENKVEGLLLAGTGATPPAFNTEAPTGGTFLPGVEALTPMLQYAMQQIGTPYKWGGESPLTGFDCSGLVWAAYNAAGKSVPRTAQTQYNATQRVTTPQPGDLVFFGTGPGNITHVGIYLGGGMMVDAPHSGALVRMESVHHSDLVGYGRFV